MRTSWLLASGLVAAMGCGGEETPPVESGAPAALEASRSWVQAHPTGWTVEVGCGSEFARGPSTPPTDCVNGTRGFQLQSGGSELLLFFACGVQPNLQSLRDTLDSAVIDALPHGVELEGWRFQVLTPVSRFSETLTVQTFADQAMTMEIVTPLYAISGHSTAERCQIADGAPEGCSSFIEHQIPLTLRLCGTLPAALF